MLKFLGNAALTFLGIAVTFGVYYVMNGFEMPSMEKLTFGIAVYALFTAVESKKIFD